MIFSIHKLEFWPFRYRNRFYWNFSILQTFFELEVYGLQLTQHYFHHFCTNQNQPPCGQVIGILGQHRKSSLSNNVEKQKLLPAHGNYYNTKGPRMQDLQFFLSKLCQ